MGSMIFPLLQMETMHYFTHTISYSAIFLCYILKKNINLNYYEKKITYFH